MLSVMRYIAMAVEFCVFAVAVYLIGSNTLKHRWLNVVRATAWAIFVFDGIYILARSHS